MLCSQFHALKFLNIKILKWAFYKNNNEWMKVLCSVFVCLSPWEPRLHALTKPCEKDTCRVLATAPSNVSAEGQHQQLVKWVNKSSDGPNISAAPLEVWWSRDELLSQRSVHILDLEKNKCYYKPLSFGVVCYTSVTETPFPLPHPSQQIKYLHIFWNSWLCHKTLLPECSSPKLAGFHELILRNTSWWGSQFTGSHQ